MKRVIVRSLLRPCSGFDNLTTHKSASSTYCGKVCQATYSKQVSGAEA
jgi:hypothetical protein